MPQHALLNSAILAAGSVAIALPLGTLLAVVLTRYDVAGRRLAAACLGMLLFLPLYVVLAGWDAALGKLGWISLASGAMAEPFLAGLRGAIVVHGLAAVPWAALIVGLGLLQVAPAEEEAALLVGPPRLVLWRVTLPQSLPFLLGAAIWIVVGTTSEMTVTNIYLVDPRDWTSTERFYMAFAASDAQQAVVGVWPAVAALAIVVASALWMVRRLSGRRKLLAAALPITFRAGRWRTVLTILVWLIIAVLVGVPLGSLIVKAGFVVHQVAGQRIAGWSLAAAMREVVAVPHRFGKEIVDTLAVASAAALLALVVGTLLAWRARTSKGFSWLAIVAVTLGLALPGPLVGAALIHVFNHDLPPRIPLGDGPAKSWLLLLYDDTFVAPVIAQAIKAVPLVTLFLWHSFASLSDDVLEAAALDGLSPWRVFTRIVVPQRWRAILAAAVAGLAVAAGDLAWAHLVTPPGLDLLQRRVFGLLHAGVEEQVAAISLVVSIAYAGLALSVLWLRRPRRDASY